MGEPVQYPPIGAVTYPPITPGLTVADFLDTSKPLLRSNKPPTKPAGPSFIDDTEQERRRLARTEKKVVNAVHTSKINGQRVNERRYLKAQYEFEREKRLAERTIYHKEKTHEWQLRLQNSPFLVDLAGDSERVEEEMYVREMEERRRQRKSELKKKKIKNEIIIKALSEVPVLEQARRQKKQLMEQEKRDRALRDVQRVEVIQEKKLLDTEKQSQKRLETLDERQMGAGMPAISSK
eukprot:TRINITY_DN7335_c0_g1_i1.p2 TRINITY_DN7335_c0_g1~~TRINITY_DN7335_c0_g1_i1.p2  ORF type:complete len:261 (+),score=116.03 TRINITY_DN7335_c0_g1_i1:74-784(+)